MFGSNFRQHQQGRKAQSARAGSSEMHSRPPETRLELTRKKRRISPHSTGAEWNALRVARNRVQGAVDEKVGKSSKITPLDRGRVWCNFEPCLDAVRANSGKLRKPNPLEPARARCTRDLPKPTSEWSSKFTPLDRGRVECAPAWARRSPEVRPEKRSKPPHPAGAEWNAPGVARNRVQGPVNKKA